MRYRFSFRSTPERVCLHEAHTANRSVDVRRAKRLSNHPDPGALRVFAHVPNQSENSD
jgi:hypothetical protein